MKKWNWRYMRRIDHTYDDCPKCGHGMSEHRVSGCIHCVKHDSFVLANKCRESKLCDLCKCTFKSL